MSRVETVRLPYGRDALRVTLDRDTHRAQVRRGHRHQDQALARSLRPDFHPPGARKGHILGCLGEAAVALALGHPPPTGDLEFDGAQDLPGGLQIRTTRLPCPDRWLKVKGRTGEERYADPGDRKVLLVAPPFESWFVFDLVGWEFASVVRETGTWGDPTGGTYKKEIWTLPETRLRPVFALLTQ